MEPKLTLEELKKQHAALSLEDKEASKLLADKRKKKELLFAKALKLDNAYGFSKSKKAAPAPASATSVSAPEEEPAPAVAASVTPEPGTPPSPGTPGAPVSPASPATPASLAAPSVPGTPPATPPTPPTPVAPAPIAPGGAPKKEDYKTFRASFIREYEKAGLGGIFDKLEKIPEFTDASLTDGQRILVAEALLASINKETNLKVANEFRKTEPWEEKLNKVPVVRKLVSYGNAIHKGLFKGATTKETLKEILSGKNAQNFVNEKGGEFIKLYKEQGLDAILQPDGKTTLIDYAKALEYGDASPEAAHLNKVATEFSRMPQEWSIKKESTKQQNKQWLEKKLEFDKAIEDMAPIYKARAENPKTPLDAADLRNKLTPEGQGALMAGTTKRTIELMTGLSQNPAQADELRKIATETSVQRALSGAGKFLKSNWTATRLLQMASGGAIRATGVTLLAGTAAGGMLVAGLPLATILAASAAGAGVGFLFRGGKVAKQNLLAEAKNLRNTSLFYTNFDGTKKFAKKTATSAVMSKIEIRTTKLKTITQELMDLSINGNPIEVANKENQLKTHLKYIEEKIQKGEMNFGDEEGQYKRHVGLMLAKQEADLAIELAKAKMAKEGGAIFDAYKDLLTTEEGKGLPIFGVHKPGEIAKYDSSDARRQRMLGAIQSSKQIKSVNWEIQDARRTAEIQQRFKSAATGALFGSLGAYISNWFGQTEAGHTLHENIQEAKSWIAHPKMHHTESISAGHSTKTIAPTTHRIADVEDYTASKISAIRNFFGLEKKPASLPTTDTVHHAATATETTKLPPIKKTQDPFAANQSATVSKPAPAPVDTAKTIKPAATDTTTIKLQKPAAIKPAANAPTAPSAAAPTPAKIEPLNIKESLASATVNKGEGAGDALLRIRQTDSFKDLIKTNPNMAKFFQGNIWEEAKNLKVFRPGNTEGDSLIIGEGSSIGITKSGDIYLTNTLHPGEAQVLGHIDPATGKFTEATAADNFTYGHKPNAAPQAADHTHEAPKADADHAPRNEDEGDISSPKPTKEIDPYAKYPRNEDEGPGVDTIQNGRRSIAPRNIDEGGSDDSLDQPQYNQNSYPRNEDEGPGIDTIKSSAKPLASRPLAEQIASFKRADWNRVENIAEQNKIEDLNQAFGRRNFLGVVTRRGEASSLWRGMAARPVEKVFTQPEGDFQGPVLSFIKKVKVLGAGHPEVRQTGTFGEYYKKLAESDATAFVAKNPSIRK